MKWLYFLDKYCKHLLGNLYERAGIEEHQDTLGFGLLRQHSSTPISVPRVPDDSNTLSSNWGTILDLRLGLSLIDRNKLFVHVDLICVCVHVPTEATPVTDIRVVDCRIGTIGTVATETCGEDTRRKGVERGRARRATERSCFTSAEV